MPTANGSGSPAGDARPEFRMAGRIPAHVRAGTGKGRECSEEAQPASARPEAIPPLPGGQRNQGGR